MRVFVLCTGRCGSTTFAEAFTAADNFTSGHESRTQLHPSERLTYPDQHIEADNRLSWFLGELDQRYGDDAHYVHLRRDPEAVAQSYAARWPMRRLLHDPGIMGAYAHGIFTHRSWPEDERIDLARSYVRTVTTNIELFLRDRPRTTEVRLEALAEGVATVWDQIGAEGDRARAVAVAHRVHNPSPPARTTLQVYSQAVARRIIPSRRPKG